MAAELTIFVAKIMAILFVCVGINAFFNKNAYQKIVKDTFSNAGVSLLFGLVVLVVSIIIVNYHNIWTGWAVLVTIIGWLGLVKGVVILTVPKLLEGISMPIFKSDFAKLLPYTTIIIGLVFGYFGFIVG
jgi:hypothetical protein